VTVPEGVDVRAQLRRLVHDGEEAKATVRVRTGAGYGLRRRALAADPAGDGWDVLTVPYAEEWALAEELASYGADVVALDPPELRRALVRRLRSAAEAS
jgi:proteasome accessory factor B